MDSPSIFQYVQEEDVKFLKATLKFLHLFNLHFPHISISIISNYVIFLIIIDFYIQLTQQTT